MMIGRTNKGAGKRNTGEDGEGFYERLPIEFPVGITIVFPL
jgi:hypothetical protein